MKIYRKVAWDTDGKRIYEDSYDYEGEIRLCKGGTTVEAPKPSAAEIEMQKEQLKILQQQKAWTEEMEPYTLKGLGLKRGDDGQLEYMTEAERIEGMGALELAQYELTKRSQERQAQAYAGELPISPAMEKSLAEQEQQMTEALSQRLGPDWMKTTSGQQAMSEFQKRSELLREEARRGAITSEGGLLMSNLGFLGNVEGAKTQQASAFPYRTSGLFSGYGQAQQPHQYYSGLQHQTNISNAQNKAGLMQGYGQLAGTAAGVGIIAF